MRYGTLMVLALIAGCAAQNDGASPVFKERPLDDWVADAARGDEDTRAKAAWALSEFVAKSAALEVDAQALQKANDALKVALRDDSGKVRGVAVDGLASAGPAARGCVDGLIGVLQDREHVIRLKGAWALGNVGPPAAQAIPALTALCRDKVPTIQRRAAWALGRIGPASAPAAPDLIRMAEAAKGQDRQDTIAVALEALTAIGPGAAPTLGQALFHEMPDIRTMAVTALGQIDPVPAKVVPALVKRLLQAQDHPLRRDSSLTSIRVKAALVLGRMGLGDKQVMAALLETLTGKNPHIAAASAKALGMIGSDNSGAVDALILSLDHWDRTVRLEAVRALGMIGGRAHGALEPLSKLLQDPDEDIRAAATEAIAAIRQPG